MSRPRTVNERLKAELGQSTERYLREWGQRGITPSPEALQLLANDRKRNLAKFRASHIDALGRFVKETP